MVNVGHFLSVADHLLTRLIQLRNRHLKETYDRAARLARLAYPHGPAGGFHAPEFDMQIVWPHQGEMKGRYEIFPHFQQTGRFHLDFREDLKRWMLEEQEGFPVENANDLEDIHALRCWRRGQVRQSDLVKPTNRDVMQKLYVLFMGAEI